MIGNNGQGARPMGGGGGREKGVDRWFNRGVVEVDGRHTKKDCATLTL